MNIRRRWHSIAAAAAIAVGQAGLVAAPLVFTGGAVAQTAAQSQAPRVTAFDVRQLDRIEPGADLEFTLWGTPDSEAVLSIEGAQRVLRLIETSPGVYQGFYTIGVRDRIEPDARVTANMRRGNFVGTALLDETLQRGWTAPPVAGEMPKIDRFTVTQGGERRIGAPIHLTLVGTPGGRATAHLPGATQRRVLLREVRAGEYVGTYIVQASDRLDADEPVVARLRVDDRVVTTRLEKALDRNRLQYSANDPALCATCGKVVAINRIEIDGDGRYIGGTVVGGLLGAAIGSQVGGGDGRKAAGVVGALGGALIGREIEKRRDRREAFEVVIQMTNGQRQAVVYEAAPPVRVGDSVRVDNNQRLERI